MAVDVFRLVSAPRDSDNSCCLFIEYLHYVTRTRVELKFIETLLHAVPRPTALYVTPSPFQDLRNSAGTHKPGGSKKGKECMTLKFQDLDPGLLER